MAFDGMEAIFTKNNFSVLRVGFANFKLKIATLKIGVKTLDCFNFGLFICHFFVSLCQHLIQGRNRCVHIRGIRTLEKYADDYRVSLLGLQPPSSTAVFFEKADAFIPAAKLN